MKQLLRSNFAFPARQRDEGFELDFEADASSGLPLLSESGDVLRLVLTYLALPYSVVEYGCGKKTSLILDLLHRHGLPAHALSRGMVLERDLSEGALDQNDSGQRPHALTARNPLYERADLEDDVLLAMLAEGGVEAEPNEGVLHAGDYRLRHAPAVQFARARSHVFPAVAFWDEANQRAATRAIDPTLRPERLVRVEEMRALLGGDEAFLLEAALLGHFHIAPEYLTQKQDDAITVRLPDERSLDELSWDEQAALLRDLLDAPEGSVGDPRTWTYANNMPVDHPEHQREQLAKTGRGDRLREPVRRLILARQRHDEEALEAALDELNERTRQLALGRVLAEDARWSEAKLRPLAELANILSHHWSVAALASRATHEQDPVGDLDDASARNELRGIGVRLRGRIEALAWISADADSRIDARALNDRFVEAACETIRQMNRAGLAVFLDQVGNIHGLALNRDERAALRSGETTIDAFAREALCHGSHIDTVADAGKFDGRLGVLSGIEIARILHDLHRFHGVAPAPGNDRRILVSAFMGEEMTFTGHNVALPGSAAVVGNARPETVHDMRDAAGERLGDRLVEMLRALHHRSLRGELQLEQSFEAKTADALVAECPDPRLFFTPRMAERHIEQGPELDRRGVPLVLAGRIMGIRQEDFTLAGPRAEAAGLDFVRRLRELNRESRFSQTRVTVGVFRPSGERARYVQPTLGLRWRLAGQVDHAGAISVDDRHDAGVAAGMLVHRFLRAFAGEASDVRPLVGSVKFHPGENRNVIPGLAELTLGVEGPFPEQRQRDLLQTLHTYSVSALTDKVSAGGAGCSFCGVQAASFLNVARWVRLSVDLRAEDASELEAFETAMAHAWDATLAQFGVEGQRRPKQTLEPFGLEPAGQALQIERSYGGSHNPREAELPDDVLAGTLLQLGATWDYLRQGPGDARSVRELTAARLPRAWTDRMPAFTSGALHDSCNFAARARRAET